MIAVDLHVVLGRDPGRLCPCHGVLNGNDSILFGGEHPHSGRIDAMRKPHRLDGPQGLLKSETVIASLFEHLTDLRRVLASMLQDPVQVPTCQGDEDARVRPVHASHRGRDESPQAGPLQSDAVGVDLGEGCGGITGSAYVRNPLPQDLQEFRRVLCLVLGATRSVVGQMNQECVQRVAPKVLCEQPTHLHARPRLVDHDERRGSPRSNDARHTIPSPLRRFDHCRSRQVSETELPHQDPAPVSVHRPP